MPACCFARGIEARLTSSRGPLQLPTAVPEKKARRCGGQRFREEALRQRSAKVVFRRFGPSRQDRNTTVSRHQSARVPSGAAAACARKRMGAGGFARRRSGSNACWRRIGCARSGGELHEHVGYFRARRRADRRRCAAVAASAGIRACAGLGQRAGDSASEAARRHPDAQDAVGAGLARRAEADRRPRTQGQRVCERPRSPALDQRAAQWRRARRGIDADRRTAQERVPLCDAGDDAARRSARRQRRPHHPVARP